MPYGMEYYAMLPHSGGMSQIVIPTPEESPTVSLPFACQTVGLGRTAGYDHAEDGTLPFPVLRCGGKYRVPTAALRRVLELDGAVAPVGPVDGAAVPGRDS